MKKTFIRIFAAVSAVAILICFAACGKKAEDDSEVNIYRATVLMSEYLAGKGFADGDILTEGEVMTAEGEDVYVFSWRVREGHADRLFGMYAVSLDGKRFYEYQPARDEWIMDMNTGIDDEE